MIRLIVLLTLLWTITLQGGNHKTLLQFLGHEEALFYKNKENGPFYRFNQTLLNAVLGLEQAEITSNFKTHFSKAHPVAPAILEALMIHKKAIFVTPPTDIGDLIKKTPRLLLDLISDLQAEAPASCIDGLSPIKQYQTDVFYQEKEVSAPIVLFEPKRLTAIFQTITKYNKIVEKCREEEAKKLLAQKLKVKKLNESSQAK